MPASETPQKARTVEEAFFSRLGELGRGDLAILRRNAGNTLGQSRDALGLFYRLLPPALSGTYDEEVFFLAATLFAVNPTHGEGDFGAAMKAVDRARGGGSHAPDSAETPVDRRMRVLLDSQFERVDGRPGGGEIAYRLRQCVRLAASVGVGFDGPLLLRDLRRWEHPDRYVQKRWARSYFSAGQSAQDTDTKETTDAA